jgi:hypothetical protein
VNDLAFSNVGSTTKTDLSEYVTLAPNPGELVDSLSEVLTHGPLSDTARTAVINMISTISDDTRRTQTALYLVGSSSQFQVEH